MEMFDIVINTIGSVIVISLGVLGVIAAILLNSVPMLIFSIVILFCLVFCLGVKVGKALA